MVYWNGTRSFDHDGGLTHLTKSCCRDVQGGVSQSLFMRGLHVSMRSAASSEAALQGTAAASRHGCRATGTQAMSTVFLLTHAPARHPLIRFMPQSHMRMTAHNLQL